MGRKVRENIAHDRDIKRIVLDRQRRPRCGCGLNQRAFAPRDLSGCRDDRLALVNGERASGEPCLDGKLREKDRFSATKHEQTIAELDASHRNLKRFTR